MTHINIQQHPNIQNGVYFSKDKVIFFKTDKELKSKKEQTGSWKHIIKTMCNGKEFIDAINNGALITNNVLIRAIFLNGHNTNLSINGIKSLYTTITVSENEFREILRKYIVEIDFEII